MHLLRSTQMSHGAWGIEGGKGREHGGRGTRTALGVKKTPRLATFLRKACDMTTLLLSRQRSMKTQRRHKRDSGAAAEKRERKKKGEKREREGRGRRSGGGVRKKVRELRPRGSIPALEGATKASTATTIASFISKFRQGRMAPVATGRKRPSGQRPRPPCRCSLPLLCPRHVPWFLPYNHYTSSSVFLIIIIVIAIDSGDLFLPLRFEYIFSSLAGKFLARLTLSALYWG